MNPDFSLRRFSIPMVSLRTLHSIKFVIGKVNLVVSKKFEFGGNCHRDTRRGLLLDPGAFRDELTLEDTIYSKSLIMAKTDWFGPCEAPLEEYVLKVGGNERVLNPIAPIVNGLRGDFPPFFRQTYCPHKKQGIKH